jgi:hypothetical protein
MTQDGGLLGRTGSAFGDTNGGEMPPAATADENEAHRVLLSLAHRKTGAIPAPLLVRHVLSVTRGADWPVQRAAMEALLRRCSFGKQDRLEVASAPRGRTPFGFYGTRRAGSGSRPYTTWLGSVDPLRGSCDCPDYLRNSLGACKHLLAVLDRLAAEDKQLQAATTSSSSRHNQTMRLVWDPVRPLKGDGDWLERIRLLPQAESNGNGRLPEDVIRKWFRHDGDSALVLGNTHRTDPAHRLELVTTLAAIAGNGGRRAGANNVEPAVRALLRIEQQHLRRATDALAGLPEVKRALRSLKRQLYPYQVEGVSRLLGTGRLLLADDMGLGIFLSRFQSWRIMPMVTTSAFGRGSRKKSPEATAIRSDNPCAAMLRCAIGATTGRSKEVQRRCGWRLAARIESNPVAPPTSHSVS